MGSQHRALGLILLLATVTLVWDRGPAAAEPSHAPANVPPSQSLADRHPKLDSQLVALAQAERERGGAAAVEEARARGLRVPDQRVQVVIESSRADRSEARQVVALAGGQTQAEYANLVQALLPIAALETVAARAEVRYVRPPFPSAPAAVAGEGVAATNASAWQTNGLTGTGVKVAIIDGGFAGYTARQASGDLPASLTTADYCGGQLTTATDHGTAVAEIVHQMAPGAQLFLICENTEVTLGQAKDYAKSQGVQIVNHSVGYFNTSRGDGTGGPGTPDAIVADARANGILWVNALGNHAQKHWSGTFSDPDNDGFHNFSGAVELNSFFLSSGSRVCATLKWDDWPTSAQDYDLYLYRISTLVIVQQSLNPQTGTQPPTEAFCYTNFLSSQSFGIAIRKFSATTTPRFDLFIRDGPDLEYKVPAGSVLEPGSSPNAMAAGAICWQNDVLGPYSSQGPTIDGRIKPDIAGQDSVSTATYGSFTACGGSGFPGTSAAAPHVAGAAALVSQANPSFNPAQLQAFLEGRAVDLGGVGKDNTFGAGKLSLGTPPPPTITSFIPASGPVMTNVTITGTNFTGASAVRFNGTSAIFTVNSSTQITATVPSGATSGPISVTTPGGTATSSSGFTVLVPPAISGFTPASGIVGTTVTITGTSLTGATAVQFNGVSATFTVGSDSQITATVPSGATSGLITISGPGGTVNTASSFVVVPAITGFTPSNGIVGTSVTITGTSFTGATAVRFNGVSATFTVGSDSQITAIVPSGVSSGPISVTTSSGTATSAGGFHFDTPCDPRPEVRVTAVPNGDGRLRVTVTAQTSLGTPSNTLQAVRFVLDPQHVPSPNALIEISGQAPRPAPFDLTLPAGTAQTSFLVRRATPGQATTVPMVVVDACRDWPTDVGGGPNAF